MNVDLQLPTSTAAPTSTVPSAPVPASTVPVAPAPTPAGSTTAPGRPPTNQVRGLTMVAALWTSVVSLVGSQARLHPSWHFFVDSSHFLFDGAVRGHQQIGGLNLYAKDPQFQFGPVSVAVAQVIKLLSFGHSVGGAEIAIAAVVPLIVWCLLDARRHVWPDQPDHEWFVGALVSVILLPVVWTYLSLYSLHLDDAVAVTLTVIALWAVARHREVAAGLALGAAVAAKPWAAGFLPLVLALPRGRRLRAAGAAAVVMGLCWAPFVVGGKGTISALGHFQIKNSPNSALRRLGVSSAKTPSWDRMAQLVLGAAAATWCVKTGRWPAAVMAAVAIRIALDPGAHGYYTASVVAVVLAWELIASRRAVPLLSAIAAALLIWPHAVHTSSAVAGDLRLAVCVMVLGVAVSARPITRAPRRPTASPALSAPIRQRGEGEMTARGARPLLPQ